MRKLFESSADRAPLVLVFDDLHWAEPTLLDLIEHIVDFSRRAPILIACLARPELLDHNPRWCTGKPDYATMLLEPLGPADTAALIAHLLPACWASAWTLRRKNAWRRLRRATRCSSKRCSL